MAVWRPQPHIRVKALGLLRKADRLLVAEVEDDAGRVKGHRPLGGSVEFGERWEDALLREFSEELGVGISVSGPPMVLENIYQHEGETGHEVLFIADVTLRSGDVPQGMRFLLSEDDGTPFAACWMELDAFQGPEAPALYPDGLLDLLTG